MVNILIQEEKTGCNIYKSQIKNIIQQLDKKDYTIIGEYIKYNLCGDIFQEIFKRSVCKSKKKKNERANLCFINKYTVFVKYFLVRFFLK